VAFLFPKTLIGSKVAADFFHAHLY